MNKQVVFWLPFTFYTTINQHFRKTTQRTHASRFYMATFWRVLIRSWWLGRYWLTSKRHFKPLTTIYSWKKKRTIGFSNHTIDWFKSYLSNRLFRVNLENCYSDPSNSTCGVPQVSILGPLLLLISVNDMPQAVRSNLFLYTDDSCLVSRERMLKKLKNN